MINAIIIEDELPALEHLKYNLQLTREPVNIIGTFDSVEDSVDWLRSNPPPQLIFMDIQLKDGNSFSIFEQVKVSTPIIFTTAFDNYLIKAFEQTSIEYLLKPINEPELSKAINKYKDLKSHFLGDYDNLLGFLSGKTGNVKKRIVARRGIEHQSIPVSQVAYFYTDQKITFLITREGNKLLMDRTLKELEEELDPAVFFRANRKFIVSIDYIKSYKPIDKIKILVELSVSVPHEIIVSQESAIDFRKWVTAL